jgi:hypothetical protein
MLKHSALNQTDGLLAHSSGLVGGNLTYLFISPLLKTGLDESRLRTTIRACCQKGHGVVEVLD